MVLPAGCALACRPHSPLPAFLEASRRTDGAGGRLSMSPTLCGNAVFEVDWAAVLRQ
jgi:hypothetical protein